MVKDGPVKKKGTKEEWSLRVQVRCCCASIIDRLGLAYIWVILLYFINSFSGGMVLWLY